MVSLQEEVQDTVTTEEQLRIIENEGRSCGHLRADAMDPVLNPED